MRGTYPGGLTGERLQALARRLLVVLDDYAPMYVELRGLQGELRRRSRVAGMHDFWDGDAITAVRWLEDEGYVERLKGVRPMQVRPTAKGAEWAACLPAFHPEPAA